MSCAASFSWTIHNSAWSFYRGSDRPTTTMPMMIQVKWYGNHRVNDFHHRGHQTKEDILRVSCSSPVIKRSPSRCDIWELLANAVVNGEQGTAFKENVSLTGIPYRIFRYVVYRDISTQRKYTQSQRRHICVNTRRLDHTSSSSSSSNNNNNGNNTAAICPQTLRLFDPETCNSSVCIHALIDQGIN